MSTGGSVDDKSFLERVMMIMNRSRAWRGLALAVITAAAVVGASLTSFAADWAEQDVLVTLTRVSADQVTEWTVTGLIKDEETLYLPVDDVFGPGGIAWGAAEWTVRDGKVYFPRGNRIESVEIETVDGVDYVPALETLSKLGLGRSLVNKTRLTVQVW